MKKDKHWHSKEKLENWFMKLSPEKRLEIAMQIEMMRRGAKIVKTRENNQRTKQK